MKALTLSALFALLAMTASAQSDKEKRADALDAQFKNEQALPLYLELVAENPNDSELHRKVSKQYGQLMELTSSKSKKEALATKALAAAQRAVELDPENPNARIALAISYGKASFLKSPKERLQFARHIKSNAETALRAEPDNPVANHILGRWHYEVVTMNPAMKFAATSLFGSLPDASMTEAVTLLGKAARSEPDNVLFIAEYGRALAEAGQDSEARHYLEKATQLPPKAPGDNEAQQRARKTLLSL